MTAILSMVLIFFWGRLHCRWSQIVGTTTATGEAESDMSADPVMHALLPKQDSTLFSAMVADVNCACMQAWNAGVAGELQKMNHA